MSTVPLFYYIILSSSLFGVGIFGIIYNRKSMISIMIAIEIMLLAVNINFVSFSSFFASKIGSIFSLFILAIAAAEMAIGLAILVVYYNNAKTIMTDNASTLKD